MQVSAIFSVVFTVKIYINDFFFRVAEKKTDIKYNNLHYFQILVPNSLQKRTHIL